ncbi:hypothetical protein BDV93DRAFT_549244 [Ceratobasidium sp. AG-I]|nr:hypothetical protein BDV93DRAFT_549244 [Ceratobasidium sp. AG-I]
MDYFAPFASGDRPQPAPLPPSAPDAVFLYLGAGLDLYPVAARYADFSTFLYVDAKPRLTRAPGHQDHAAWRAPADVARAVIERAGGNLDRDSWELVAPEVLRFRGPGDMLLYYVFATLDFELVGRASSLPLLGKLLRRVEALYVHGLYISPETNLHLPSLRAVYAIPGNASCADVDFVAEHDCTPPTPSHPDYIPTRAERQHYNRLCVWAGVKPEEEEVQPLKSKSLAEIEGVGMSPEKLERAIQLERQLERFIGLPPAVKPKSHSRSQPEPRARTKAKSKGKARSKPVPAGPPLRFVLIDQIVWDEELPCGTLPPPPVPSKLAYSLASDDGHTLRSHSRTSARKESSSPSRKSNTSRSRRPSASPSRKPSIPHILPPLPTTSPSLSSLYTPQPPIAPKRFSRPRSGGGAAQGLVQSPKRPAPSQALALSLSPLHTGGSRLGMDEPRPQLVSGGYRVAKTVGEAEAIWAERDRKERERLKEEKKMRERGGFGDWTPPVNRPKTFLEFLTGGIKVLDRREQGHAHTV